MVVPTFLFPLAFLVAAVIERVFPARPLPPVRRWLVKGVVFFALAGVINAMTPPLVAAAVGDRRIFELPGLGVVAQTIIAMLVVQLAQYLRHRATHAFGPLWRWTHQMHHSAERVDIPGFSYQHPFDLVLVAVVGPVLAVLLGVTPEAASLAGFALFAISLLGHMNIRTPMWLGYVVQRPEQHVLHHARGVHAFNYSALPIWDLVFGTFRNPRDFAGECGFGPGASARVGAMLLGRDVAS